jgi:hypothetical protein
VDYPFLKQGYDDGQNRGHSGKPLSCIAENSRPLGHFRECHRLASGSTYQDSSSTATLAASRGTDEWGTAPMCTLAGLKRDRPTRRARLPYAQKRDYLPRLPPGAFGVGAPSEELTIVSEIRHRTFNFSQRNRPWTYQEIQEEFQRNYGIEAQTCWISDLKRKSGLPTRRAWNRQGDPMSSPAPGKSPCSYAESRRSSMIRLGAKPREALAAVAPKVRKGSCVTSAA